MGYQFFVIVLLHGNFLEPVSFIESLCRYVGDLNMKIYRLNLEFWVVRRGGNNMFEAFRA